jgi:hypothetical protein
VNGPSTAASSQRSCAACQQPLAVNEEVIFLPTGRVEHVHCPASVCAVCGKPVLRDDAARRFRGDAFHEACWARRSRTIAGGAGEAPWTPIFDRRLAIRAATDPSAHHELPAVSREVRARCRAMTAWSREVRASVARRRRIGTAA